MIGLGDTVQAPPLIKSFKKGYRSICHCHIQLTDVMIVLVIPLLWAAIPGPWLGVVQAQGCEHKIRPSSPKTSALLILYSQALLSRI